MALIRRYLPEPVVRPIMYVAGMARSTFLSSLQYDSSSVTQITERIFLGSLTNALDDNLVKTFKFTHIISVLNGSTPVYPHINYMTVNIDDDSWHKNTMLAHFNTINTYITNALQSSPNNKILIHCQKGVSRSVTVLAAYLIYVFHTYSNNQEHYMTNYYSSGTFCTSVYTIDFINSVFNTDDKNVVQSVLKFIVKLRKQANPISGFISALEDYNVNFNNPHSPSIVVQTPNNSIITYLNKMVKKLIPDVSYQMSSTYSPARMSDISDVSDFDTL